MTVQENEKTIKKRKELVEQIKNMSRKQQEKGNPILVMCWAKHIEATVSENMTVQELNNMLGGLIAKQ